MATIQQKELEPGIKEVHVHFIFRCSDSRGVASDFNRAMMAQAQEERGNGILLDVNQMNVAGTFATPEIITELRSSIFDKMMEYSSYFKSKIPVVFFVNVTSHGSAKMKEGKDGSAMSPLDLEVDYDHPTSCGMRTGSNLAIRMEDILLQEKPTLKVGFPGKEEKIKIDSEAAVKKLMLWYGHHGTISTWIEGIDNLALHPLRQKNKIKEVFEKETIFMGLDIRYTASLHDFAKNKIWRVDGNTYMQNTFLEKVFERMNKNGQQKDLEKIIAHQHPELGVWHQSSIEHPRQLAYQIIFDKEFAAGSVFGIGGRNLAEFYRLVGPYKNGGFFLASNDFKVDT